MKQHNETDLGTQHVPMLDSVERAAALLAPEVERIGKFTWEGDDDDQYWEFFKRGIIKRQFEALETIIHLAKNKKGHFGVTLLRPAYEEMLWGTYLQKHKELAPKIALLLSRREVDDTIQAQNQYLGAQTMKVHGFTQERIIRMKETFNLSRKELRDIGKSLEWRNNEPPGAAALARSTGHEREYNFIYQATSRYVHFSTLELGRRVWGNSGSVNIGSDQFSSYWSDFSLYWSFRIYIYVSVIFPELWLDEDNPALEGMLDEIENMYPVPIITASELESW